MADRVVLRKDKEDGSIVAFLPDATANLGRVMCYAHIGQHSEASLDYYRLNTTPLTPEDYSAGDAMVRELTSIGYEVRLVRRLNDPIGGWRQ